MKPAAGLPVGYEPISVQNKYEISKKMIIKVNKPKKMGQNSSSMTKNEKPMPWVTSKAWAGITFTEKEFEVIHKLVQLRDFIIMLCI